MTTFIGLLAGLLILSLGFVFGLRLLVRPQTLGFYRRFGAGLTPLKLVVFAVSLVVFSLMLLPVFKGLAQSPGDLTVQILSGYNLVVDSNATATSTASPSAATVAGRICNTGTVTLTNVVAYIGDHASGTPGIYPSRDSSTFTTEHPALLDTGSYAFTHEGGSRGLADASRQIGDLGPGQCVVQYWTFSYPRCANDADGTPNEPPCETAVWGDSVKPQDDLWLNFDVWATADSGLAADQTWKLYLRNEISAMANKIQPNPDGEWFNTATNMVKPGGIITTNGIRYTLGNVNKGFDNDGNFTYDYNFWVQPIGDASQFDVGCFRLIQTSGLITVNTTSGTRVFTFTDRLYFTDMPSNNTNITGEIYYTFMAIGSQCSAVPTPYQEAASGADNEKFNADYGSAGPPRMVNEKSEVTINKAGTPDLVSPGQVITYSMTFPNSGTGPAGLLTYNGVAVNQPVVVSDSIPVGTTYNAGSAVYSLSFSPNNGVTILYSTDNGQTWSSTQPTPASSVTNIEWWLKDPLPAGQSGVVTFSVTLSPTYTGPPLIDNCADVQIDGGGSLDQSCVPTRIQGNNTIGNEVWQDLNYDGQRQSATEPYVSGNITTWLYWDKNGDGNLDSNDVLFMTTTTGLTHTGYYTFTGVPDGDWLVKVDRSDPDLPSGYGPTTPVIHAITGLSNTTTYVLADFGFAPSLDIQKSTGSSGYCYLNHESTHNILLTNKLKGSGQTVAGGCQYETWAQAEIGTSAWVNPGDAFGAAGPDNLYASSNWLNNTDILAGGGFSGLPETGNIVSVKVALPIYLAGAIDTGTPDWLAVRVLSSTTTITGTSAPHFATVLNDYQGQANKGVLLWDITTARSWQPADFGSSLSLELATQKNGQKDGATLYVDAAGFYVTYDGDCPPADPANTIQTIPVTDTYDTRYLQYLSASPAPSSLNTATGVITWNNVGPLEAGDSTSIRVTFLVSGGTGSLITNTAATTGALFVGGTPASTDLATATCTITPTAAITGRVWSDANNNGWQPGTGFDSGDYDLAGVELELYDCVLSTSNTLIDETNVQKNKTCAAQGTGGDPGVWRLLGSTTTDANGYYLFDFLSPAYYYVKVVTTTLPGSSYTQTAEADFVANGAGHSSPLDHTWGQSNVDTTNLQDNGGNNIFNPLSAGETITQVNFGYTIPALLYGVIWLDRDGDGVHDSDDPGLDNGTAGITVTLTAGNGVTYTTQTDASGNYRFTGLTYSGTYTITVDTATLPPGYTWSNTYDPDGNHDSVYSLTVRTGETSGSHDFGYYRAGTYSLGDTVYADWNGNGVQDPGEEGLAGVTVSLRTSSGTVLSTTTTSASGYYTFTNLFTNTYVVYVDTGSLPSWWDSYQQTQDPDEVGVVCSVCDSRGTTALSTTNPSTDVIDFGYQPTDAASIGDYVWLDTNGDGVQDAFESGLGGITVQLYRDLNADGVIDPEDALISQTTTTSSGYYNFTNLSPLGGANGAYLVQVLTSTVPTDTFGNPYQLTTNNNPLTKTLAAGENYDQADFGFVPPGLVGDFIWQDSNGNGSQDPGEPGIPGVTVELYTDGGTTLVGMTTTDASGAYTFTGVISGNYTVRVDTTSLSAAGYTQTGDPDANGKCQNGGATFDDCDSESTFNLGPGQVDRTRDFGYKPGAFIGDYVWLDANGDGVQDPDEPGINGVVITLTTPSGITKTTTTAPAWNDLLQQFVSGYYGFGSDIITEIGDYGLEISISTLPAGVTQSYDPDEPGGSCTTCDNTASVNVTSLSFVTDVIDFGYVYTGAYYISGTVFYDAGGITDTVVGDIFDPAEDTPYRGVTVYLWNDSNQLIGSTTTGSNGQYLFNNLPAGSYTVSLSKVPQFAALDLTASPAGPGPGGVVFKMVTLGPSQTSIDFGFYGNGPTYLNLSGFTAYEEGGRVIVRWETASEMGTVGFDLYRQDNATGQYLQVNRELLFALLESPLGGVYRFVDDQAAAGESYTYWLVETEFSGQQLSYGPFTVQVGPKPAGLDDDLGGLEGSYSQTPHPAPASMLNRMLQAAAANTAGALKVSAAAETAPVTAAKITLSADGLYYLDAADIASAMQLDAQAVISAIGQGRVLLSNRGQPAGTYPAGENQGLYFYGENPDSMYTLENVYWLTISNEPVNPPPPPPPAGGEKNYLYYLPLIIKGDQVESGVIWSGETEPAALAGSGPPPANGQETFTERVRAEENRWVQPNLFDDPQADFWFWDLLRVTGGSPSQSKNFTIQAAGAAASGQATFTVYLHGYSDTDANPDHHVVVALNGAQVGESRWDGPTAHRLNLAIDQSLLHDGPNTVTVTALKDSGVLYSIFYVDAFELTYQRHYRAVDNRLLARGEGHPVVTIEGFSDPNILLFDVTEPLSPQLVTAVTLDGQAGNYRVSFSPAAAASALYAAVAPGGARAPLAVIGDAASDLKQDSHRVDYLVIVPPERKYQMKAAAQVLADYRQQQGLNALVVDLEDIYDEFNDGLVSPEAIRSFLAYAYQHWQAGPRYVVLAGEGSFDYKNNLANGDSLVPPLLVGTPYGLYAADNRFGDVVGDDGVPEMAIGRLPVLTAGELQALVDKIIAYESSGGGGWQQQVLLLADKPDIEDGNFPVDSEAVAGLVTPGYGVEKVYLSDYAITEARSRLLSSFNNGNRLVNYFGHGSRNNLSQAGLLTVGDVAGLANGERLPVMAGMTCNMGQFDYPGFDSLAEALLLKTGGGAIAVWSPTGLSLNSEARILDSAFFREVFSGNQVVLGQAVLEALRTYRAQGSERFMLDIYNLLGDPALRLK